MLKFFHRFCDRVNTGCKVICGVLMAFLAVVCCLQVFCRYCLNNSLTWSEESMRYVFVWMIFLATPSTVKEGSGACIDILRTRINGRISKSVYEIIVFTLTGITAVLLIIFGARFSAANTKMLSAALHLPMWLVYLAVPVGSSITVLHCMDGIARAIERAEKSAKISMKGDCE